jgi:hypothetical protein
MVEKGDRGVNRHDKRRGKKRAFCLFAGVVVVVVLPLPINPSIRLFFYHRCPQSRVSHSSRPTPIRQQRINRSRNGLKNVYDKVSVISSTKNSSTANKICYMRYPINTV